MASGGARARSGPPPDPNALRRKSASDAEWVTLPAEGRAGDSPAWPLPEQSSRESDLWIMLWRKPQAVEWERLGMEHDVALYVRRFAEAEEKGSPTALGTLVRQMGDSLGISIPGMRSLRWRIGETAPEPKVQSGASKSSARGRLKVVAADAGA